MDSVRISQVRLLDVGPFTNVSIDFPDRAGINLVCGDNGIGKTTLLESVVAMFSQGHLERLRRRQAAEIGKVSISYCLNGTKENHDLILRKFEAHQGEWVNAVHQLSPSIINIRAARDFTYLRQDSISRDPSIDNNLGSHRLNAGLNSSEIKTWFSNRYLLRPHAESSSWTSSMLDNLDTAVSFFSLLDPSVKLDRVDVRTFDIIVSTPSGLIPFEFLSSGFRSAYILLLGIIKEIEFRGLDVSAKDFSGLIVIDELDLHLHPVWQREIGKALKNAFPNAQIIASTHSPHVIQSAQASEVIALVRDAEGTVRSRPVPSTRYGFAGWTLEEVLEDIMGVEDTKTPIFRKAMRDFDDAVDRQDGSAILDASSTLLEMLHPNNALRKLIEIEAAPYVHDDTAN